jgi:hypothetical protein
MDENTAVAVEPSGGASLCARRGIRAGEEITVDSSVNVVGGDSWSCDCGAVRCRGTVVGDVFALPPDIQRECRPLLADWFVRRHARSLAHPV